MCFAFKHVVCSVGHDVNIECATSNTAVHLQAQVMNKMCKSDTDQVFDCIRHEQI